jgi:acyl-CoA hydrolase
MDFRPVQDSAVTYTELMIPAYANFGGKVHGGILLSIMDKVAYVCASKHCDNYVVTVAVEGVEFLSPVEVGDLLTVKATVDFVGNSTMIVGMQVECYHTRTKTKRYTNSCHFTMAAKDENGKLTTVPGLIISSQEELIRFCEGRLLRELSKAKRNALDSDLAGSTLSQLIASCESDKCRITF